MSVRVVKITMTAADPVATRAWGEVKAVDRPGTPTVAHVEARLDWSDAFTSEAGRHSFHFRVTEPSKVTLTAFVDGAEVGPQTELDCTVITAGRRYNFEVPA